MTSRDICSGRLEQLVRHVCSALFKFSVLAVDGELSDIDDVAHSRRYGSACPCAVEETNAPDELR